MFTQTYQIWLLTAGVIHFCPTRLCAVQPGWEKISSAAVHLLSEHRNSYQRGCSTPTNPLVPAPEGNGFAEKVGAGGEKLVPLSPSLAYFSPWEAEKRQASFPRWENTPSERRNRPPAPKTSPPAPLPSHTHTYRHSLCFTHTHTHTQPVRK